MKRLTLLVLLVVSALKVAPARADSAPTVSTSATASPADQAADLFRRANALYEADKLSEAEALYLEAWALSQTWDIACNLGIVELDLGKHRDAAEHLAFSLREYPAGEKTASRKALQERLSTATGHVAILRVSVNVEGAEVLIDGKSVGKMPLAPEAFVNPGTVKVEARREGFESRVQTLEAKKGGVQNVAFTLVPKSPPPERSLVAPVIALGVGGAGLVLGIVTGAVAISGKSDLSKTCDGSKTCPESARGELDTTIAMSHVATAGLIAFAAGAAV